MIYEEASFIDSEELTDVAVRSKRHWGYSKEAMELWNENLTITENYLKEHTVIKAVREDEIVGFFRLEEIKPTTRIAHFWIDTPYLSKGYGSYLFKYMMNYLTCNNVEKDTIVMNAISHRIIELNGLKVFN